MCFFVQICAKITAKFFSANGILEYVSNLFLTQKSGLFKSGREGSVFTKLVDDFFYTLSYEPANGDWVQASVSTGSIASNIRPVRMKQLTGTVSSGPYKGGFSGL